MHMYKYFAFYYFLLTLLLPNFILSFTEQLSLAGALTNILLPAGIIWLLSSLSPKFGRSIWLMFPLIFFAAFQIVLLDLYGRSVIAVDMFLNLVTTNTSEVAELLGNMLPVIIAVVVLYVPSLTNGVIFIRKKVRLSEKFLKKNRLLSAGVTAAGLISLALSYSRGAYAVTDHLYPANVCYNVYLAFDRTAKTGRYSETSANFKYGAHSVHLSDKREIYLLVVGETARADNWQLLGYNRPTNPRLADRNDIYAAPEAYSESNTTHKSVPMLLSPVNATDFNTDIYQVKSLITAFKEAGFSTAFLSNQRYNRSFIDFFAEESDTCVFIKELDDNATSLSRNSRPDSDLLPWLDNILAQEALKQLIVLHTYGSHFNYLDRYAKNDELFTPCDYTEVTKSNRDKLINAYDNTIVATDRLLTDCISRLDSIDGAFAGLLYTSDHGEDIFDNGSGRFLHASPRPTLYQVHVPMIAWLSAGYRESYPDIAAAVGRNISCLISTSRSFCPSAFEMAGIKVSGNAMTDTAASIFSDHYEPREQLYLTDHNTPVTLKSIL